MDNELEDRMVEIIAEEQNNGKRMKRIEDSLRDFGTILNAPTFELQGFQKKKKKGTEKIFEEIIIENFPKMGKEIVNQVQEAPLLDKRKENTSRHILMKLTETKHKEKILKAAREKQQVTYKGKPI